MFFMKRPIGSSKFKPHFIAIIIEWIFWGHILIQREIIRLRLKAAFELDFNSISDRVSSPSWLDPCFIEVAPSSDSEDSEGLRKRSRMPWWRWGKQEWRNCCPAIFDPAILSRTFFPCNRLSSSSGNDNPSILDHFDFLLFVGCAASVWSKKRQSMGWASCSKCLDFWSSLRKGPESDLDRFLSPRLSGRMLEI